MHPAESDNIEISHWEAQQNFFIFHYVNTIQELASFFHVQQLRSPFLEIPLFKVFLKFWINTII